MGTLTGKWPPVSYYVGCVLVALVIVYVEKASHVTAGGVAGLGVALYGLTGWSVGLWNILVKILLFAVVYWLGGRRTAIWTIISAILIGLITLLFEALPIPVGPSPWLAFVILVTVAYFPTGLLLSRGYSTGGFSSIAQILWQRHRLPIWLSMLVLNGGVIVLMDVAFGHLSGMLTLFATVWQGTSIHLWTQWCKRYWVHRFA